MRETLCRLVECEPLAQGMFRIRLDAAEIARAIRPGQFIMVRPEAGSDPLLGRAYALYDTYADAGGEPAGIDIVIFVAGKMTARLATAAVGESIRIWGPLGNGFLPLETETVNLVAGGIGQTPFLAYAKQLLGRKGYAGAAPLQTATAVNFYYGHRSAKFVGGIADFEAAGADVHLATEDGTLGTRGNVLDLLRDATPVGAFVGCGPDAMLHALADFAKARQRTCHVSLETPMACGIGICFSCVARVKCEPDAQRPDGWDYRRTCVEGPLFDAATLHWPELRHAHVES